MAWIPYIPHDFGDTDNILRIHGVHPQVGRCHLPLYRELMHKPGPLRRDQREMIGLAVSAANGCVYWVEHHGSGLRAILERQGQDTTVVEALAQGEFDSLDAGDRVMLDYALKLTRRPADMERSDVEALRQHGFSDGAVHDICAITAYFAFVNRIADGLGVELE